MKLLPWNVSRDSRQVTTWNALRQLTDRKAVINPKLSIGNACKEALWNKGRDFYAKGYPICTNLKLSYLSMFLPKKATLIVYMIFCWMFLRKMQCKEARQNSKKKIKLLRLYYHIFQPELHLLGKFILYVSPIFSSSINFTCLQ